MGLRKTPRYALLAFAYAFILNASYVVALFLKFDGEIPARYVRGFLIAAPFFTVLSLLGYAIAGLFQGLWRYASTVTLFQIVKGVTLSVVSLGLILVFSPQLLFPRTLTAFVWLIQLVLLGGLRFAWRLSRERLLGPAPRRSLRTLVVGADHTGVHLIQEMRRGDGVEQLTPIGFIDDNARFTGSLVEGVPVLGTIADLPRVLSEKRVEMLVVSDPGMPARVVREIANFCAQARVRVKTLPGLSDLQQGRTALSQMRDMRLEDLLGREPVNLDMDQMREFLRGQRVLVTGAGGSIGSELARQVADFGPAELVLLDHAENGLYYVHNELVSHYPKLRIHPIVMDIKDVDGLGRVFGHYQPKVVFHAAAHKHVPLLETNAREAVLNNIVGTRNLVNAADAASVDKFVLISTDKAVNPTSVMGASKRVCEMLCQSRSQRSRTRFIAVRFGNVLGSDGSVIPLFQRQIARGGPITVTHPEARRFFMTIPEAVRLVLQAGSIGRAGEVLLLDMGEQVRIVDLARQLIRMSGLSDGEDIEIVFTGLRPGEKLYEELHSDAERMRITRHERILAWDLDARDEDEVLAEVAELEALAQDGGHEEVKQQLKRLVPEYCEPRHDPIEPTPMPTTPVVELPGMQPARTVPEREPWTRAARRGVEIAVASFVLLLSAPLWLLLRVEAWRTGQEAVLVHETRIGRTRRRRDRRSAGTRTPIDRRSIERRTQDLLGEPFGCVRFRSDLGPVSRWIARHHLSELPFLINVIRCEMVLVGPRPETEEHILRWQQSIPDYDRLFTVMPGITGLAQLSGYSEADPWGIVRRAQYDLYYVDYRSLLLDIRTLIRTVAVVLRGDGFLRADASPGLGVPDSHRRGQGPSIPAQASRLTVTGGTGVKGVTR